jgi:hypothetical protein
MISVLRIWESAGLIIVAWAVFELVIPPIIRTVRDFWSNK